VFDKGCVSFTALKELDQTQVCGRW
jgi:hypothetical protein